MRFRKWNGFEYQEILTETHFAHLDRAKEGNTYKSPQIEEIADEYIKLIWRVTQDDKPTRMNLRMKRIDSTIPAAVHSASYNSMLLARVAALEAQLATVVEQLAAFKRVSQQWGNIENVERDVERDVERVVGPE